MALFGPRCKHRWVEVHRDVQPRARKVTFSGGLELDWLKDVIFGCTHVELRCEECGDVASRKLGGEHPNPDVPITPSGTPGRGRA